MFEDVVVSALEPMILFEERTSLLFNNKAFWQSNAIPTSLDRGLFVMSSRDDGVMMRIRRRIW